MAIKKLLKLSYASIFMFSVLNASNKSKRGRSNDDSSKSRFCTGKPIDQGIYEQATKDCVFKYLMNKDSEIRNSFLTAVIGEEITSSEVRGSALNPIKEEGLRKLIHKDEHTKLMKAANSIRTENHAKLTEAANSIEKLNEDFSAQKALNFVIELAPFYDQLKNLLPDPERDTQLDLICKTKAGWINVEVQVLPQNFWDIRILDHVCGLFHRQFTRGFKWKELEIDCNVGDKIKRVIGISIFADPPKGFEKVKKNLPWYSSVEWGEDELYRNYQLCDTQDMTKIKRRGGIEFRDFNLNALTHLSSDKQPKLQGNQQQPLKEWLELFASSRYKSDKEVEKVHTTEVKKAYKTLMIENLPENVREEANKEEEYIQKADERMAAAEEKGRKELEAAVAKGRKVGEEKGRKEGEEKGRKVGEEKGRKKVVKGMLRAEMCHAEIAKISNLSLEEVKKIASELQTPAK